MSPSGWVSIVRISQEVREIVPGVTRTVFVCGVCRAPAQQFSNRWVHSDPADEKACSFFQGLAAGARL